MKLELAYQPSNRTEAPANTGPIRTAILVVAGVVLVVVFIFAVPFIVKSRAIAAAHDAGFEMTAEHVGVGFGTAVFRGVTLKASKVPGVTATIDQLSVTGMSVKKLHAVGMTFTVEGDPKDFGMGLGLMLSENRVRFAGTAQQARRYTIASSKVEWKGTNGVDLSASDFGAEIESRGNGNEDVKLNVGKLTYNNGKTTMGPWGVTVDESPTSGSRVRVSLDPAVPDGPSLLLISQPSSPATTITLNILRAARSRTSGSSRTKSACPPTARRRSRRRSRARSRPTASSRCSDRPTSGRSRSRARRSRSTWR